MPTPPPAVIKYVDDVPMLLMFDGYMPDASWGHVAVAVTPRLLGEALARALRTVTCKVVVDPHCELDLQGGPYRFDLAIVTNGLPAGIWAQVIIRLPATPTGTGEGRVCTPMGERVVPLSDLGAVIDLLRDLLRRVDLPAAERPQQEG